MKPLVFISSITSDIGIELSKKYSMDGYTVAGTYRSTALLPELQRLSDCHLFYCDLRDTQSIRASIEQFSRLNLRWETFISCAAWPPPLTNFFDGDFEEWSDSIHVNCIEQLRVLHLLYPLRRVESFANVCFFAGPGTNNAVKNFSALTLSKIMLIKMCELLDAETPDLNVFIIGPGWTKTKTHLQILADPHVSSDKRRETLEFMKNHQGTSMMDIYRCIRWLSLQGRAVASGRNISVVHDAWETQELASELSQDVSMYKLRRYRNEWKNRTGCK